MTAAVQHSLDTVDSDAFGPKSYRGNLGKSIHHSLTHGVWNSIMKLKDIHQSDFINDMLVGISFWILDLFLKLSCDY